MDPLAIHSQAATPMEFEGSILLETKPYILHGACVPQWGGGGGGGGGGIISVNYMHAHYDTPTINILWTVV